MSTEVIEREDVQHEFRLEIPGGLKLAFAGGKQFVSDVYRDIKSVAGKVLEKHGLPTIADRNTEVLRIPVSKPLPTDLSNGPVMMLPEAPVVAKKPARSAKPRHEPAGEKPQHARQARLVQIITITGKPLKPMSVEDAAETLSVTKGAIYGVCSPSGQARGNKIKGCVVSWAGTETPAPTVPNPPARPRCADNGEPEPPKRRRGIRLSCDQRPGQVFTYTEAAELVSVTEQSIRNAINGDREVKGFRFRIIEETNSAAPTTDPDHPGHSMPINPKPPIGGDRPPMPESLARRYGADPTFPETE